MLEYNLNDAEGLLRKNQQAAAESLKQVEEQLSYITEQTTTLEVSILYWKMYIHVGGPGRYICIDHSIISKKIY